MAPVEMPPPVHLITQIAAIVPIMTPLSSAIAERTVVTARVSRTMAAEEALQPVAHIDVLAPAAVEELHRHDVGEGVDQPAR